MASGIENAGVTAGKSGVGRDHPWRIAFISSAILILELAFIRQVPAEVRSISYFTNLILMAAFFGLGLGCILQERRTLSFMLPLGLFLVFGFVIACRGIVIYSEAQEVHYWLQYTYKEESAIRLPLVPAAAMAFVFAALPFVAMGQILARAMDEHPKLVAYGWNIAGSLAGTILFTLSSSLHVPPWIWPPILMVLWIAIFIKSMKGRALYLVSGLVFLAFSHSPHDWIWSPYYFIQYSHKPIGTYVWVNSSFHQLSLDFNSPNPDVRSSVLDMSKKWGRPYRIYKHYHSGESPKRVLILGAGMGNDVNIALSEGAEEIVAVEIDPVILELGRKYNTAKPYDDPKVRALVDDARHMLATSEERFDMIIFGTIDSQALLSGHANLRLENYVYTRESLQDARSLLNEGGLVAIHYSVFKPWLYSRIYTTFREVFGDHSMMFFEKSKFLFNTTIIGARDVDGYKEIPGMFEAYGKGIPSIDDWPFIYLQRPTIAPVYQKLFAIILILIAGAVVVLRKVHVARGFHVNFLMLGLGFTLMESSAIVRLALLFGSTWTVNAVVFSVILLTIFLGNLLVLKGKAPALKWAWAVLFLSIIANYFFPLPVLFQVSAWVRVACSGVLIGIPVLFASFCFSHLFKKEPVTGYPLGINMIGAMAGGLVEYLSMLTGMRAIWLVVLCVYLAARLTSGNAIKEVEN